MKLVRGSLPGLPGDHDIALLDGDTHICKWIEEHGRLDQDANMLPRMDALKLIDRNSVVYDLGAMVGDLTAWYASRARAVVAFEAFSDAYACLEKNISLYANASAHNITVGNGELVGYGPMANNKGSRYVQQDEQWGWTALRIDDFVGTRGFGDRIYGHGGERFPGPPTFIKVDIEGWEVRAFRGAENTLRERHPTVLCEVHRSALSRAGNSAEELHALLSGHGYRLSDFYTGKPWSANDPRPLFDAVAIWEPAP